MPLHAFITSLCRKDIAAHNLETYIERLVAKLEQEGAHNLQRYPNNLLKKQPGDNLRLIIQEIPVDDAVVLAFLRVMPRGSKEYERFILSRYDRAALPGHESLERETSLDNLRNFIAMRARPLPPPPPAPSEREARILYAIRQRHNRLYNDFHVCETELWTRTVKDPRIRTDLSRLADTVLRCMDAPGDIPLVEIRCEQENQLGVLCRRLEHGDGNGPKIVLFAAFFGGAPRDEVRRRYPELLQDTPPSHEACLRRAKNVYPLELALVRDAWRHIQETDPSAESAANIALSPEEIGVLRDAADPQRGYPLFINGRAGSGKSTILQYLFTEYALDYLEHDWQSGEGEPALFAANDLLIEASKTAVTELLMARLRGNEQIGDFSAWMKPRQEAFDRLFKNLHSHLRSLLPPDRFPADSLIDYAGFRAWWQSSFGLHPDARRYYNADISWHVIRSFIKGYDPESLLDADGYKELPASQRTISQETFEFVYERVWRAYKEHLSRHGLWDHQDLAREILVQNRAEPRHPALFCDEAQDFTRIELDLLYRLCLYTGRAIGWQDQSRIPIAFAGDPFQTLNPTGFRWDAIRAFYTERFIRAFPGQPKAEIQYHELRYNYRSNRRIVRFCNLIQLIRAAAFGHRNLLPQRAWEEEEGNPPQVTFLDVTQPGVLENLKASPDIRIIVPCDEGDEILYAAEHNLDRLVRRDNKGTPQNISSATRVKGLEFDRVALFGFGGACPQSFLDALRPETPHLEGDAAVEPEYFVNKLYVAASRPRKRLFIIDTPEAIERFWKGVFDERPFTSLVSSPKFAHLSKLLEHWQGQTGFVVQGDPAQILTDQTEAPERLAARLERDGVLRKQAYPLRQAALYFEDAGDNKAALRCRARACEFEGEFLEAAALWREFGDLEAAIRAAWQADDGWARLLLDIAAAAPRLQHDPRVKFAAFLRGAQAQPDPGAGLVLLRELRDALSQSPDLLHEVLRVRQWRARIEIAISRMRENRRQDGDSAIWKAIHTTLTDLGRHGIALAPETLGRAAFLGGLMKEAIAHWERVPPRDRAPFERDLLRARAASAAFPDNLLIYGELLSKSGQAADAQEAVRAAVDGDPQRLQPRHQKVLAEAWLILRDTTAVAKVAEALDDLPLLCRAAETAASSNSTLDAKALIRRITILLVQDARWRDLLAFLRDGILPAQDLPENHTARYTRWAAKNLTHAAAIVEAVALDGTLETARNEDKENFARFVEQTFNTRFAWKNHIHPLRVGQALELSGLFRCTIPYYRSLSEYGQVSAECRRAALIRLAFARMEQAEYYSSGSGFRRDIVPEAREEAARIARELGFSSWEQLPKAFPDPLPPIEPKPESPPASPAGNAPAAPPDFARSARLGPLQVRVSPAGDRVNIEHAETFEVASLLISERRLSLDGQTITPAPSGAFEIPSWGLRISLDRIPEGIVSLSLDGAAPLDLRAATSPASSETAPHPGGGAVAENA